MLDLSDEDLVEYDRNIMLFGGQEFVEEIPDRSARAAQVRQRLIDSLKPIEEGDDDASSLLRDSKGTSFTFPQSADFAQGGDAEHSSAAGNRKLLQSCGDSRSVVNNQNWPHTSQIVLGTAYSSTSNSLAWNSCSATLVADSTALSAAHCFWDVYSGSWTSQYSWAPGYDHFDSDPSPNGMWKSCYGVTIKSAYTQQNSYSYTAQKWDYAVMTFHQCTEPVRNGIDPSVPGATLSLAGYWMNAPTSALGTMYNRGYPGSSQTCPGNQVRGGKEERGCSGAGIIIYVWVEERAMMMPLCVCVCDVLSRSTARSGSGVTPGRTRM